MILTTEEAAKRVGVTHAVIRKWVQRGVLAPIVPGAKVSLFREGDVIDARHATTSTARHAELDRIASRIEKMSH